MKLLPTFQRPKITSAHIIAVVALAVGMAGSATAAVVISGADIKNNSVSTKDIKDKSLLLKDFKGSERKKLKGATGAQGPVGPQGPAGAAGGTGAPGAAGASGFTPPPSGTLVSGSRVHSLQVSGSILLRDYIELPFRTIVPLTEGVTGRNLWFAPAASVLDTEENATACPGNADAPNPVAGNLCIYIDQTGNVTANSIDTFAGLYISDINGPGDTTGAAIRYLAAAAGEVSIRYVWAYKAP